jgi:UDP-N-acetylmuramoylalanine--D-glutamate ligase
VALAGNNDTPFSSVVLSGENFDVVVLEVSSFQLESVVDFVAGVAVLLNIAPDHLDRYNSFEDYARAKLKIFERQHKADFAIVNKKDETTTLAGLNTPAKRLWFSVDEEAARGAFVRGDEIVFRTSRHDSIPARTGDVMLRGTHNMENVLAALCAAFTLGGDSETFSATLRGFAGLEHRMEHIATIGSVEFINDSKATNVDALARALESLSQPVVLIAGGRGKRSGYDVLQPLVESRVRAMVLIGEDAPVIERTFSETTPVRTTATLPEAVETAWNLAKPGDVVLLSPACASFDMFRSFEERGEVFKHAVKEVEKNHAQGT